MASGGFTRRVDGHGTAEGTCCLASIHGFAHRSRELAGRAELSCLRCAGVSSVVRIRGENTREARGAPRGLCRVPRRQTSRVALSSRLLAAVVLWAAGLCWGAGRRWGAPVGECGLRPISRMAGREHPLARVANAKASGGGVIVRRTGKGPRVVRFGFRKKRGDSPSLLLCSFAY